MRRSLLCSLSLGLLALWAPAAAPAADSPIVRFATTLGNIDVRLLPGDAPQTVANFMGYVNRGDYNGSFFHRSAPGFVIQGGGYTYAGGAEAIPQQAPVQNEFKVSNTRGTLAMAKLGGDPNSATNQWFFNESDSNAANLDNQNGGFTVFGRVIDSGGLSVMDAIASQSTVNAGSSFDQLPVVNYTTGGPITGNNLISVNSITVLGTDTTAPAITITRPAAGQHFTQGQTVASAFACNDGDGVGVATCSAPGVVDTRTVGAAAFTVTATDSAGNATSKLVSYVVDAMPDGGAGGAGDAPGGGGAAPATTSPTNTALAAPWLSGAPVTSGTGVVALALRCPRTSGCSGKLSLYAGTSGTSNKTKRIAIGSTSYRMAAGKTAKLKITLTAVGKKLLKRGNGRLAVALEITPTGQNARATTKRLTLKTKRTK